MRQIVFPYTHTVASHNRQSHDLLCGQTCSAQAMEQQHQMVNFKYLNPEATIKLIDPAPYHVGSFFGTFQSPRFPGKSHMAT